MRGARILPAALLLAGLCPAPLAAQGGADSATVVAGARYAAGGLHEALLGRSHRELWTTPVRLPVLPPDTLGGLTPTGTGGGLQTISLVLRGGNGREYRFRPVEKTPGKGLDEDLRGTVVQAAVQDQISSLNPAGALVADRILDAAGVLHASPRLYVMPDHPFLGEYRERFAGKAGLLEERPEEDRDRGITFAGADEIKGTENFLEAVEESPRDRLETREYLAARLVDLFLGDWDRHSGQWRWARYDRGEQRVWRPIPRDRDYVFADYDGLLVGLSSGFVPQANRFTESYAGTVPGLTHNGWLLDRRLLGGLPGAAWDSVARSLRARITDAAIDEAVDRLPEEYDARVGRELRRVLRARRDALPEAARTFYARLAIAPEIHGTDGRDVAHVQRRPGGEVALRIWAGEPRGAPYLERTFLPAETEEIRVLLHGGDDHAVVEGEGGGILVRVLGGGGGDLLEDRGRGGRTVLHDHEGENRFARGAGTVVDRREYEGPELSLGVESDPPRDWGAELAPFAPFAGWRPFAEVVVGGGPTWTRYGFRRHPWASLQTLRALWAPLHPTRFGVEYQGRFRRTGTGAVTEILARATGLEARAFHGFGNDTPEPQAPGRAVVWERQLLLRPGITLPVGRGVALALGGELRHTDPGPREGSPARLLSPLGARAFTTLGASAGAAVERVDDPVLPRNGVRARVEGAGFPLVREVAGGEAGGFGRVRAAASGYLSPFAGGPTLALRAWGETLGGLFPSPSGAFRGGAETLRGYRRDRFVGDAALLGSAELRQVLTRAKLVLRGELGVLALADAGRVWSGGESEGGWHTAVGGGIFFSTMGNVLTLTYAHGERHGLYAGLSLPY